MGDDTITYTGDGTQYYSNVPMRDLTRDEFNQLDTEQAGLVLTGELYTVPESLHPATPPVDTGPSPSSAAAEVIAATVAPAPDASALAPYPRTRVENPMPVIVDETPHE